MIEKMRKISIALFLLFAACASSPRGGALQFDHLFMPATPGATAEGAALQQAGFLIAPTVNEHEGQGTASITVEFEDSFLEFVWLDPKVSISDNGARAAEKTRKRSEWRSNGASPFSIGLRRVTHDPLPFSSWSVAPPWLPPGAKIEIYSPRDDVTHPTIFLSPPELAQTPAPEVLRHPNGARRITALRLITPRGYRPIAPLQYLQDTAVLKLGQGEEWLLEVTCDGGVQKKEHDFRPTLPLRVRY